MTEHADLEAASAYLDGEAPGWASHIAACTSCRATVADLRAVQVAVSVPVEPTTPEQRDRLIAAAVAGRPESAVVAVASVAFLNVVVPVTAVPDAVHSLRMSPA